MNRRNIVIAVGVLSAIIAYGYVVSAISTPDTGVASAVFSSLLTSAALTGTLLWLTKTWIGERVKNDIKYQYDQKLESHKAQLKADQEVAIENCRADLRIAAFEHETRFAELHAKRAEIVAETYARLQDLVYLVADYVKIVETSADPPHEERRIKANDALKEFGDYYRPKRIYLPGDTEKRIDDFVAGLYQVARSFARGVEGGLDEKTGRDSWGDADEWMESKAKPLFADLKNEFRQLLGDQEAKAD